MPYENEGFFSKTKQREKIKKTEISNRKNDALFPAYAPLSQFNFDMTLEKKLVEDLSRFTKSCMPNFEINKNEKQELNDTQATEDYSEHYKDFNCLLKKLGESLEKNENKEAFFLNLCDNPSQSNFNRIKKLPTLHDVIIFVFLKKRFYITKDENLLSLIEDRRNSFNEIFTQCKENRKNGLDKLSKYAVSQTHCKINERELIKNIYLFTDFVLSTSGIYRSIKNNTSEKVNFFKQETEKFFQLHDQEQHNYYARFYEILQKVDVFIHANNNEKKEAFISKCCQRTDEKLIHLTAGEIITFGYMKKRFSGINEDALLELMIENNSKPYLSLFQACEKYMAEQQNKIAGPSFQ